MDSTLAECAQVEKGSSFASPALLINNNQTCNALFEELNAVDRINDPVIPINTHNACNVIKQNPDLSLFECEVHLMCQTHPLTGAVERTSVLVASRYPEEAKMIAVNIVKLMSSPPEGYYFKAARRAFPVDPHDYP